MPSIPKTSPATIGLIQHACPIDASASPNASPEKTRNHAIDMMRDAANQGATTIITQELFHLPYFCRREDDSLFDLAETIPGPTTDALCTTAKKLNVEISASLFEKRATGVYHNTTVFINPTGKIVGTYRKMHIPDDPSFYEKFYFTPGDPPTPPHVSPGVPDNHSGTDRAGWQNFNSSTSALKFGPLICWDQWFPEAARLTAMRGADVLLYPTAIGYLDGEPADEQQRQRDAWITMQRSHAIANGIYVAACNRVGREGELQFWGSSFIADPGGTIIAQASQTDEQILLAPIDPARIEATRRMWPFLRDRRIDAYSDLTKRLID